MKLVKESSRFYLMPDNPSEAERTPVPGWLAKDWLDDGVPLDQEWTKADLFQVWDTFLNSGGRSGDVIWKALPPCPTPDWPAELLAQVKEYHQSIRTAYHAEQVYKALQAKTNTMMHQLAKDALKGKLKPDSLLHVGEWSCSRSPVKRCCYDMASPMGYDACLFCGDPAERK